ncbi:MAG: imidazolonepropionase [Kosmotogales bacterium]|nr:imidazolonepropionase [Kosmotogales bacterium]
MNKYIIKNPSQLITCSGIHGKRGKEMMDLNILENSSLVIEGEYIKDVGKTENIFEKYNYNNEYTVIDASGKVVMPGFIDSHTHFVFGGYREKEFNMRVQGKDYMEIMRSGGGIISTVKETREESYDELLQKARKRLDHMLSLGITTVEGKSGYGLDFQTEIKQLEIMKELNDTHPIDIISTYLGAHSIPDEYKDNPDEYINYIIEEVLPYIKKYKLAEFCDVFCEKNVFSVNQSRKLLEKAKQMGFNLKIHADEMVSLGGSELAVELGATSADHLLNISEEGIKKITKSDTVATLLPGTAFSLREKYANAREIINNNAIVAIASDFNPGSCFTEYVPFIILLSTLYMGMKIEEAITAYTINAAAALNRENKTGSLDIGKLADLIIIDYPSYEFIQYHMCYNPVEVVFKRGRMVYKK